MGFQEAAAKEITLYDDDPDALETILRYLYGLDPIELPTDEMAAKVDYGQYEEPRRRGRKAEGSTHDLAYPQNVYRRL
jgi:hypothetical protein